MSKQWDESLELLEREIEQDRLQVEQGVARVDEALLEAAMQRGIQHSGRRRTAVTRRRVGLGVAASMLSLLLLLTGFVRVSPAFAALMRDIPGFSGFVELIQSDQTLVDAINNEYYQPVHVSDTKNGYTLTVDGIIADERRLVILYSGSGPGVKKTTGFKDYELKDENGRELEAGITSFYMPEDEKDWQDQKFYDKIEVILGVGGEMPQGIQLSGMLKNQRLQVSFPIDHKRFKGKKEVIHINRDVSIGDQTIHIGKVSITPLQVEIEMDANERNSRRTNGFIGLALKDEKGHTWNWNFGMGILEEGTVAQFHSSYFEKPKELRLVAKGLKLSDRGKSFVVNTKTNDTISSPWEGMTLESVRPLDEQELELVVELKGLDDIDAVTGYSLFDESKIFTDASGKAYSFHGIEGTRSEHMQENGMRLARYYYRIPNANYKQPLTFPVVEYPGYVLEQVDIRIK
ncbi:DUF4179 domain-containing protein [Paenibacillus sp. GCM10023252]|uniref:DUF4179 domain-containing protein n=1 Tax=Paenibacillus sp. GCM10023252 TaxID=3252649 RepID=UPI003623B943